MGVEAVTPQQRYQLPAIKAALGESGLKVTDVRRVIVTHHDMDHIGSLEAVVAASGAEVLTGEA